jgi:membrane protease subunit (stomatin/prohibitin family)
LALIDRIKYDGPANGAPWLVYKCPSEKFVLGSQLIVNQGQEAQFFKGGAALDLFGPGTHTLETGNLPLLNALVNLPFGGKTPFSAEIYYVNKTSKLDMKWGTQSPIILEDPKYGLILHIGGYGSFGVSIEDSRLFVTQIIGATRQGTTIDYKVVSGYFIGLVNTKVKSLVSDLMIKKKVSFLEISASLDDLSTECGKAISDEFSRFGVEVKNFYVMNLAPQDEEIAELQKIKAQLSGGEGFYKQKRTFDILEKGVENDSSNLANLGLNFGVGMKVTDAAKEVLSSPAPAASGVACPACGASVMAGMLFCGNCGHKMGAVCPHCGASLASGVRFCGSCGKPVGKVKCKACGNDVEPGNRFCGTCGTPV